MAFSEYDELMSAPKEKPADPGEIKAEILKASGTEVAAIPLEKALDPASSASEENEKPEAGDDDPSRVIPSAEQGMTFNGRSNHGSANLTPFIKKRLAEIRKTMPGVQGSANGSNGDSAADQPSVDS